MFRKLLLLGGMLMVLTSCQHHAKQTTIETPAPQPLADLLKSAPGETNVVKLKNGLTVLIKQDDRFPLVNARLYVHAGSGYETPNEAGISHLLEHMVFKGTKKRGPGQSARDIESVGGNMNAATSFDYTVYYVEVPEERMALGLDVITDMAFHAAIAPEELKSEKEVVLKELERGEDSPGSMLFKTLQGMIWKGSSYEWPIIGFRDTVRGLTSEDIHNYITRFYQPQSMMLAVVGKVDPDKVLAEAEKLLGGLKNTRPVTPPEPIAIPAKGAGPTVVTLPGQWNKVYLGAAFPIPHAASAKCAGLDLLAQLLGGDDTSRLYRKFKYEEQLVDDISMSAMTLERGGMLYVSATLDADKVEKFWTGLTAELAAFNPDEFTDQEIRRAKLNMEDSLFLAKETLSGLASKAAYFQFFEGGEEAEQNYLFELNQVNRREMRTLYREFVRPDRLSACVLLPRESKLTAEALTGIVAKGWPMDQTVAKAADVATGGGEKVVDLPGGGRLVLLPDATLPYTALSLYFAGGDGILTKGQAGLAALTARALTRGNLKMTATQLEDFLSDHAASMSASAGRNVFALEAKFPVRFTDDLLPVIRQTLTAPAFDSAEVERARQDQIASIKSREDRPLGLAFRHLFPFLYTSGPYSMLHQGTAQDVEKLSHADIMRFWGRQAMHPFTLAVCGQFDEKAIESWAAGLANTMTVPGDVYDFVTPEWNTKRDETFHLPGRNQAHLLMVFPIPGQTDLEDSARLELLKAVLSGQSGLLFRDLRDKQGLAYTVTAFNWQSVRTGFTALYIGTDPDKIDTSLDGFKRVLADLSAKTLPEEELTRARNILLGDYYQEHQSLISRSREAASLMARGMDRDYAEALINRAKDVTPAELRDTVRKYLDPAKAYLVKVMP
ncbi:pitrilysin family protein [Pseudodesulfovibrio sp.]|uniref:M16 family metallopeptidase n=1 Tax=Pseudodesulfovibrio sp. TaxID=2035812 RepID=UPI0026230747|nr:pitrilysin family protein [Pseudodesulfovibrio sp.]MDD3312499.1 pitrilysin family protein [Pseudodesulfovibrio sp.]